VMRQGVEERKKGAATSTEGRKERQRKEEAAGWWKKKKITNGYSFMSIGIMARWPLKWRLKSEAKIKTIDKKSVHLQGHSIQNTDCKALQLGPERSRGGC
jgi:hypothetical protein